MFTDSNPIALQKQLDTPAKVGETVLTLVLENPDLRSNACQAVAETRS